MQTNNFSLKRLQWTLLCPFAFMIGPKLLGRIDLSWWWVTLPLWILPALYLLGMLIVAVQTFALWINDQVFGQPNHQHYESSNNEKRR